MAGLYEFYLPKVDEPSIFCSVDHLVNADWIDFGTRKFFSSGHLKAQHNFDAVEEFLSSKVIKIDRSGKRTERVNRNRHELNAVERAVMRAGETVKIKIRMDLAQGLPPDLFKEPSTILTVDGLISLRWVLWTANMDNMTPEEAYIYALALTK